MERRRHPPGLYVLFFTEMWERFGFYCMLAIFVLYMRDSAHPFLQQHSSIIYGYYLGFVYFTPFFGGLLADQKLGYRWSIILGGVVLGAGYLLLAIDLLTCFFLGLAALVVGNGLFKPNISTLVGKLYEPGDPRLDGAYTIFYMGINLGAFLAPLVAQYLRVHHSFHTAFAAAGVGMGVSVVLFLLLGRWVVFVDRQPRPAQAAEEVAVPPAVQRQRHIALLIIFVVVALFWMAFKQNGNTFNLWARDCTDRTPAGWLSTVLRATRADRFLLDKEGRFSTELFQSVNPLFVVTLSPVLVWLWLRLRRRGWEPSTPAKVGIGMLLAAGAFLILTSAGLAGGDAGVIRGAWPKGGAYAALCLGDPTGGVFGLNLSQGLAASEVGRVTPFALLGAYAVLTLGELCLSPMGLSLVSKLAAPRQRSAWMGGWFAATAVGGYLSGLVGGYWDEWAHSSFFAFLACTSVFAALILLVFLKRLRAAMPTEKKVAAPPQPSADGREEAAALPSASS